MLSIHVFTDYESEWVRCIGGGNQWSGLGGSESRFAEDRVGVESSWVLGICTDLFSVKSGNSQHMRRCPPCTSGLHHLHRYCTSPSINRSVLNIRTITSPYCVSSRVFSLNAYSSTFTHFHSLDPHLTKSRDSQCQSALLKIKKQQPA